jgi:flagellar biogenesis protein FliO
VAAAPAVMPTRAQQLGLVILLIAFAAFVLFRLRG